jgi:nucleotide-binding universal stress UspA family protein
VHVLIGTDGSPLSVRAAQQGMQILGKPDQVTLLTVLHEMPGIDDGGFGGSVYTAEEQDEVWRAELAQAHAELSRTAEALSGVPVADRVAAGGDVAGTICDVAHELGVDAIIVGSHNRGGLGRLLLGSVSEHVVRHAPCPVLVVRERPDAESS